MDDATRHALDEFKQHSDRIEGRNIGLTLAVAVLAKSVTPDNAETDKLASIISETIDEAVHRFAEPDSAIGQGMKDVPEVLLGILGQIGRA